jgi:hypothetical protein
MHMGPLSRYWPGNRLFSLDRTLSAALVGCCLAAVHAVAPLIDLDPDQFNAPRLIGGLGAG